jgi:hypothetical protein
MGLENLAILKKRQKELSANSCSARSVALPVGRKYRSGVDPQGLYH